MDDICFIPNDIELRRDKSRLQVTSVNVVALALLGCAFR